MARASSVLTVLGSLLLASTCQHASAAVHRVKLSKRPDKEFVNSKLDKAHHHHEGHDEPPR